MKNPTEQSLPERGGNALSDPSAWVDRYGDFLFSHALSQVRNKVVAEELVEETFMNALRSRAGFTGGSTERDWLIALLRRNMFDYFRRVCAGWPDAMSGPAPGEPPLFQNDGEWAGHWRADQAPVEWLEPLQSLEEKEFSDILRRCIDNLPVRNWSVFTLREFDGAPAHDIAMELGISHAILRVALYRARLTLRRALETNWFGVP
jgi:RNA polymerase sigma-70 factor (TIGR02943 family)